MQDLIRLPQTRVEFTSQCDERWISFLRLAGPTLFQTPRWCDAMTREYGFTARVALAIRDSQVVAGLPFAEVDDFRGPRRVAYAFSDVCEPLGDISVWPHIEKALCNDDLPWQIRSRVAPTQKSDFTESPGVHQAIDLPASMEDASCKFHQKQRVNALRLDRAGVRCHCLTDERLVEPFYSLFARLRKEKFRLLPQSQAFFERLVAEYFPASGFGLLAHLGGQPLAAAILLSEGDTLYVKYSCSDPAARELRPANYIFREAIREAIARGYRRLDLGISIDPGLQRFKRHLGAVSVPYFVARYNQVATSTAVAQMESALSAITQVLTDPIVPLAAAIDAGKALYRYFV
jgi:CelD/BcsL family acetyltransferase involved in cellulose biosynthesis